MAQGFEGQDSGARTAPVSSDSTLLAQVYGGSHLVSPDLIPAASASGDQTAPPPDGTMQRAQQPGGYDSPYAVPSGGPYDRTARTPNNTGLASGQSGLDIPSQPMRNVPSSEGPSGGLDEPQGDPTHAKTRDRDTPTGFSGSSFQEYEEVGFLRQSFFGGIGGYLGASAIPRGGDALSKALIQSDGKVGTMVLGDSSWLMKKWPAMFKDAKPLVKYGDALGGDNGLATKGAQWWQGHIGEKFRAKASAAPAAPSAPTETAATAEGTEAASLGAESTVTKAATAAEENIWSKPGAIGAVKGAALAGGIVLADDLLWGKDGYHFMQPGTMAALLMEGDLKTRATVGFGALAAGRLLNWAAPADQHAAIANWLKPNFTDTAGMTAAWLLPGNPETKMVVAGGAWVAGRMSNMDGGLATIPALGLGAATYFYTRNVALSVGVSAVSWAGTRLMHAF